MLNKSLTSSFLKTLTDKNINSNLFSEIINIVKKHGWRHTFLINYIIQEYEINFNRLKYNEHLEVLQLFSSIHLSHTEIFKSAYQKIKRSLSNDSKLQVFNSIAHNVFEDDWAKEAISELLTSIDKYRFCIKNAHDEDKFKFLICLMSLEKNETTDNLVSNFIKTILG